jgi:20S proteasome subunit beta 4
MGSIQNNYFESYFTRRNLADYLRSRTPFNVNLLLTGYDKPTQFSSPADVGCKLYTLDYLASMVKVPYAAHGYGGFFSTALLDRQYRENLTRAEAYSLLQDCVREIQNRLIINLPSFDVTLIDENGIQKMDPISVNSLIEKADEKMD